MNPVAQYVLGKVSCSEQIMALCIFYQPEGGQMISAIDNEVLKKLHLWSERADIKEVVCCLRPLANCFIL